MTRLDLTVWNEAIQVKRTSVEQPPPDILTAIIARRSKAKGRAAQTSPTRTTSTVGNTYIISSGGGPIPAFPTLGFGASDHHRSSPPTFEGSEIENIKEYLGWLIRKGHILSELGDRARSALLAEGWGFNS